MGRYLLFAWNNSFPRGGWNDFILSHDDIQKLIGCITVRDEEKSRTYEIDNTFYDAVQIIDKELGNIIQLEFPSIKKESK